MSEDRDPGRLLRGGEFYSPVQGRLRTQDVLLSELRQPCSRQIPRHEHELAYVTIVLGGDYCEGERKLEELPPFTAVFNPSGIAHQTVIGPAGASLFTIELHQESLRELGLRLPAQTVVDRSASDMLWSGLRLYSGFRRQSTDALALESEVLELLGAFARFSECGKVSERSTPRWLVRLEECLHDRFCDSLRIRDLAADAGVHPVHMARVFRAHQHQTLGQYRQRLRLRAACTMLRDPERSLAAIAAECGFADQSHLSRVFKKLSGSTPAQFRRGLTRNPDMAPDHDASQAEPPAPTARSA